MMMMMDAAHPKQPWADGRVAGTSCVTASLVGTLPCAVGSRAGGLEGCDVGGEDRLERYCPQRNIVL